MEVDVGDPTAKPTALFSGSRASTTTADEVPLATLPFPLTGSAASAAREAVNTPPPAPIPAPPRRNVPTAPPSPAGPHLGNLLLSSCPGKKVRLTGPVKGRGAICRSLPQDLGRIRSLGVGLIINCLDDVELEFLGAPWPLYLETARSVGLDVLRIPTPEGLAPLDIQRLDHQLDWVIRQYTLKGVNVLVHCRGGVGRAGLVACCWMMKMGLCGPVDENFAALISAGESASASVLGEALPPVSVSWPTLVHHGLVRKETFQFIQKVVTTIRRRRSVKAIETYEQARFLVDFAEHVRDKQEGLARAVAATQRSSTSSSVSSSLVLSGSTPESMSDGESSTAPSLSQASLATTDITSVELDEAGCGLGQPSDGLPSLVRLTDMSMGINYELSTSQSDGNGLS